MLQNNPGPRTHNNTLIIIYSNIIEDLDIAKNHPREMQSIAMIGIIYIPVSYTHLTLPTIYSV